jgi:spermidine/putrescine transport system ATP-binding protein/putrescine transport system ATP-binding protein
MSLTDEPQTVDATLGAHDQDVIRIDHVVKWFGDVCALNDVSLEIRDGEFFALLGPSGCGKTTLLRCIGGFEEVTSGRIELDGADLVGSKPYDRPVNMMFQSYALFPHLRVRDNVAYGLKAEHLAKDEIRSRVDEVLAKVDLVAQAERRPHQLSGGQRQRVALARAIVKRPRVLLLDEPLAALDRKLRGEMQIELKRLQNEVGMTFVIVTHDQEEAMTMADTIAVLDRGRVLQVATPRELYHHPVDHFVAAFIGKMNFIPGDVTGDTIATKGLGLLPVRQAAEPVHGPGYLAVRPEAARMLEDGESPGAGEAAASGTVEGSVFVGSQAHVHVMLDGGGETFVLTRPRIDDAPQVGARVRAAWQVAESLVFPQPQSEPAVAVDGEGA